MIQKQRSLCGDEDRRLEAHERARRWLRAFVEECAWLVVPDTALRVHCANRLTAAPRMPMDAERSGAGPAQDSRDGLTPGRPES